jgi:hypothetical protein
VSNAVTTLRLGTIDRLRLLPGFADRVLDSRTSALSDDEVPALVVVTQTAAVAIEGSPELFGDRTQTMDIWAEFYSSDDATLAADADAIEAALWGALMGDPTWVALWHQTPRKWTPTYGKASVSNRLRCTLHIAIQGPLQTRLPDLEDLARLEEIRLTCAQDDTAPAYEERIPLAHDEEQP